MNATEPPSGPLSGSGERSRSYRLVEGLHLRQWALRGSILLAVLATNGAGWIEVSGWPRAGAPLAWWDLPASSGTACTVAGSVLVALSVWMRVLSKGVLVRKRELTTGGVYRLVRHPFYLANLVGAAGLFALAGPLGCVCGVLWLALALPVYAWTVRGEEEGLRTLFPDAWDRFAREVPPLLPVPGRLGSAPGSAVRVTWRNLVAEREPPRGLRFLAAAALVAGLGQAETVGALLILTAVLLQLVSYIAPGPPSRRESRTG